MQRAFGREVQFVGGRGALSIEPRAEYREDAGARATKASATLSRRSSEDAGASPSDSSASPSSSGSGSSHTAPGTGWPRSSGLVKAGA